MHRLGLEEKFVSYYAFSRKAIEEAIQLRIPNAIPEKQNLELYPWKTFDHVLWMSQEMDGWDTSSTERALKAARWIGWMFRATEEICPTWTQDSSKQYAKSDVDAGYHLPH
jgi:hypothetical protein